MDKLQIARQSINSIDKEMAKLFCKRMEAVRLVAEHKQEHGLPVYDGGREAEVIKNNSLLVEDDELRSFYINYLQSMMDISKSYQHRLLEGARIAYSGIEGAFAYIAAQQIFPDAIPYSTTNPKLYILNPDKLSELKEQYNTLIEFIVDIDSGVAIFAVNGKPQYVTDGVDASNVDLGRFFVPELESGAILVVDNITYAHYTNGYDCTFVTMTEGSAETAIGVRKEKLSQPENAKAIMAAYVSETKLASADVAPFTLEPGKLCYAKAELASGVNTDGITLYKTMLWAGESSLKPVMAPYTIEK